MPIANWIKKISVAKCYGKIDKEKTPMSILQIVGIATGTFTGESTFGPWCALRGNFEATNLQTGEKFRSSQCFMPDVAIAIVAGALASDENNAVEFGVIIGIIKSETQIGYEFTMNPLIDVTENDPIANLIKKLPQQKMEKSKK